MNVTNLIGDILFAVIVISLLIYLISKINRQDVSKGIYDDEAV